MSTLVRIGCGEGEKISMPPVNNTGVKESHRGVRLGGINTGSIRGQISSKIVRESMSAYLRTAECLFAEARANITSKVFTRLAESLEMRSARPALNFAVLSAVALAHRSSTLATWQAFKPASISAAKADILAGEL